MHPHDQRHLEAAEGWVELGNWREANAELENISPRNRAHPEVLRIRWTIYCEAGKWEGAYEIAQTISNLVPDDPFGLCSMAYALHKMPAYHIIILKTSSWVCFTSDF